ncbi:Flp pilus assembly complex ATPase component TadA [Salmonella enterica]|nr:Flp pilus assembly complex ATPase component TadA [Salmonella enterica]
MTEINNGQYEKYNERTHSLVNLKKLMGSSIANEVHESTRLLKNNNDDTYLLCVLEKLDQNPAYFDLRSKLKKKGIKAETKWINNEEITQISYKFDASIYSSENQSDTQEKSDMQDKVISIIRKAVNVGASDIHFLITPNHLNVAFRIDGMRKVFNEFGDTAKYGKKLVQSLFNSMCSGQSANTLSYQESCDARIKEEFVSEFGLSTARFASRPCGDDTLLAVIRLISKRKKELSLKTLGMTTKQESIIRRAARKLSGIIVSSGPTGHGKSTLSQCIAENMIRDDSGINLITVEDPIESPIFRAVQTPLLGNSWADAIRNLMRLDPDVIYVGEVRDGISAHGVIEAAQTGHGVVTTTHTTWCIDVIQRWRRFGVDEDLLTDPTLISCLVGLRLVPLLCPECKNKYSNNLQNIEQEMKEIIEKYTNSEDVYLKNSKGCKSCDFTGIKGRTGVFEIIETDRKFMSLYAREGKFAAWQYWRELGNETMTENLIALINRGLVDPEMGHKKVCNLDRDEKFNE